MKQESVTELNTLGLERIDNNRCRLVFNELVSIDEITGQEEGEMQTRYVYNTYMLETNFRPDLEQDVVNNYTTWLNFAKEQECNKLEKEIRNKRAKLLADTDWTQTADSPLPAKSKERYRIYRQALRDIPEQEEFPYNVEFPII